MADGPLTNLANIQCVTDSVGNLVVFAKAQVGGASSAKNAMNTRGVLEAGNALVVVFK